MRFYYFTISGTHVVPLLVKANYFFWNWQIVLKNLFDTLTSSLINWSLFAKMANDPVYKTHLHVYSAIQFAVHNLCVIHASNKS